MTSRRFARFSSAGMLTIATIAIVAMTALVYAPSLRNGLVDWDDGMLIKENIIVQHPSMHSVRQAFSTYDPELYIPLTNVSYQADQLIGKGSPLVFHFTSLLLHLCSIVAVIVLLYLLTENMFIALGIGFLFALHPIQVEAVSWASGRKDVLSSFFLLVSLTSYVCSIKWHKRGWWYAALMTFILGLLSKVTVAVEPLLLLLIDWLFNILTPVRTNISKNFQSNSVGRKPAPRDNEDSFMGVRFQRAKHICVVGTQMIIHKFPFFALSAVFGVIALFGKRAIVASMAMGETVLMFLRSIGLYLQNLIAPFGLSVLYPLEGAPSLLSLQFLVTLLVLTIIILLIVRYGRRDRLIIFGALWFLILLLPAFLTFKGKTDLYIGSDRYVYTACIGVFLIIARLIELAISRCPSVRKNILALLLIPLITLPMLTYRQSTVWRSTETLFQHTVRLYPLSYVAHSALGNVLIQRGDREKAIMEYYIALKLRPDLAGAYTALATAIKPTKNTRYIEWLYRTALAIDPKYEAAHAGLGLMDLDRGNVDGAIDELTQAAANFTVLTSKAKQVEIHNNLALAYDAKGLKDLEIDEYRKALAIDPEFAVGWYNLGQALKETGRKNEAREAFKKALEIDSKFREAENALMGM